MNGDDVPTVPTEGIIRLGQFLKLANLAESGAQARELIADGEVSVDGEVETRRGRQLAAGMVVAVDLPTGRVAARVG
jgi:ribosome-associated protein